MGQTVTVGTIYDWINEWAPFDSAETWDNVGLLVGDAGKPVTKVLMSLDVTPAVIAQAAWIGAELIVSHHPVIFRPISRLTGGNIPFQLIQSGIAAIGAHTSLDKAKDGVNDILASCLELQDVRPADDGLCRIGSLGMTLEPAVFAAWVKERLLVPEGGIQWNCGTHPVHSVGVCSGAGGDYMKQLLPQVDAFVTGELHYHEWPMNTDKTVVAAGHYHTEVIIVEALAARLSEAFPTLIVKAADEQCPYRFL